MKPRRGRQRLSRVGLGLSGLYLVWAGYLLQTNLQDGFRCTGYIIDFPCEAELGLMLASLPMYFLATSLGIEPDYRSLLQWFIYIGCCIPLVYVVGWALEQSARYIWQLLHHRGKRKD